MEITKQRGIAILISVLALTASFALGYMVGNKNQKSQADAPNSLSTSDMDLAFGSAKPNAHLADNKEGKASSLSGLVAGLEKKVAANPNNIDQQLLLAQTYNELESREKSVQLLRTLNKNTPNNPQVKITFATILMNSSDAQELKEASKLFEEAIKLKPEVANMARLYQGEIKVKLENKAAPTK